MLELKNEKIAVPIVLFAGLIWSFGPLVVRYMDDPNLVPWQYIFGRVLTIRRKSYGMNVQKFNIYMADLNPKIGTDPGKVRPVVVDRLNFLNNIHPRTVVCPITTNVIQNSKLLRVHLKKGEAGLNQNSDILIDQVRAIDNRRFKKNLVKFNAIINNKFLPILNILF